MKVYRRYRCDFGHEWVLFCDEDAIEEPEDTTCPDGHEAVTLQVERPIDEVEIAIRPAACIVDEVKGQLFMKGRYYLVLSGVGDEAEMVSRNTYSWDDVLGLVGKFRSRSRDVAWSLMRKLDL